MLAILILTHNDLKNIKDFIKALFSNTIKPFSLFILDNGSSDGTVKYLETLNTKNIRCFYSNKNLGIINGRNFLYSLLDDDDNISKVLFLDSDQFVLSEWEKEYYSLFNSGADIVGVEAWKMKTNFYPYKRATKIDSHFNYLGCGGLMVKKTVIDKIGLFDERFNPYYFEDPDFSFRAYYDNFKLAWNCDNKIFHKKHDLRLRGNRKTIFYRSFNRFCSKWKGVNLPCIKNTI